MVLSKLSASRRKSAGLSQAIGGAAKLGREHRAHVPVGPQGRGRDPAGLGILDAGGQPQIDPLRDP